MRCNTWQDSQEREPFNYLCDVAGERYRPQVVLDRLWKPLFKQRANNCGRLNTNTSLSDVLYKSAITGPSSKAKVFNMRLKIPSDPHALFHFIARSALYASHDKTSDSDGISGTTIAATSLEVIGIKPDVSPAKNALILKHRSSTLKKLIGSQQFLHSCV